MKKFVLMFCLWPMLALAEIEHARDLMEENRFEEVQVLLFNNSLHLASALVRMPTLEEKMLD